MKFTHDIQPLTADDQTLKAAIDEADIPALLITTAHLSRDFSILTNDNKPGMDYGVAVSGMTAEQEAQTRAQCLAILKGLRDNGSALPGAPSYDDLHKVGTWMMGDIIEPYIQLAYEEVILPNFDQRAPSWTKERLDKDRDFKVVIIGAGESGLATGLRLKQAGIPFVIIEKNDEVGGTWYENHYPGCRVDCNSFFYSFSFARGLWPDYYGKAPDVLDYFRSVAKEFDLYEHIVFETEVTECAWNEKEQRWDVTAKNADGEHAYSGNMLVSAVGQLNRPMMPDIAGQDSFDGPSFHSALWDHDVDYAGKKVGVIGTGASALQFIPQLAKSAKEVTVLARTTPWLLPTTLLHEKVEDGMTWLLEHMPYFSMWYRVTLAFPGAFGMLDGVKVDPDYPPTETAVSELNDTVRQAITEWMESQITDRPDLRDHLIPDTPIGGKRIIRDNGTWAKTLKRDNVKLVRKGIAEITPAGIKTDDGEDYDFDMIVYGTGFQASKFLMPMKVTGRNGTDLHDAWDEDARAYIGMTVPNFPNMFILYGPNTNQVVHGGSAILWSEFSVKYVLDAAHTLLESGATSMEVKPEVYWDYNNRIDEGNKLRAWGFSKVNSWYKNAKGRVTQNYPFTSSELWQRTDKVSKSDYVID